MDLFKLFGRIVIDSSGAKEEIDSTTESANNLAGALGATGTSADNASIQLGATGKFNAASVWIGNVLTRLTDQVFNLGKAFITSGFNYNANMETYKALFTSLLGNDTEKATQFIEDIKAFAKETPLALQGVASNAMQMLNFGFDESEILSELSWLGDIAQGDQSRLDSIVYAFSQVRDFGKLRAQELYQFVNAGVPVREMLENYLGVDKDEIVKMQENGEITFEILRNAMKAYTEEGGIFFNGMTNYMETFSGQKEKLTDSYNEMAGAFTKPFVEVATSEVVPNLIEQLEEFTTWIGENEPAITRLAESIGSLVTDGIGTLADAVKALTTIDASTLVAYQTIAGTIAMLSGHPVLGASLFASAGYTIKEDSEGGAAYKYHADENGELDVDAVSGATTVAEEKADELARSWFYKFSEWFLGHGDSLFPAGSFSDAEWAEELRKRQEDAGRIPPGSAGDLSGFQTTVENWTNAFDVEGLKRAISAAVKEGVASGLSGVTITTGSVTLNDGALVGRILPRINLGLGQMAVRDARG